MKILPLSSFVCDVSLTYYSDLGSDLADESASLPGDSITQPTTNDDGDDDDDDDIGDLNTSFDGVDKSKVFKMIEFWFHTLKPLFYSMLSCQELSRAQKQKISLTSPCVTF